MNALQSLTEDEQVSVLETVAEHAVRQSNGCLDWAKAISTNGYPRIWTGDRYVRGNRAVWIAHNGEISGDGLVCHTCDNRRCLEIKHLFLGTNDENMADMVAKGRQPSGERNGLAKLSDAAVIEIYTTPRQTKALAAKHGISETTVRDIRRGRCWGHITKGLPKPKSYPGRDKAIRQKKDKPA